MNKNKQILEHCLKYISYIEEANRRLGGSEETLRTDGVYKLAVTNALAQIGELTKKLSDEYKIKTSGEMDWRSIKGLRDFVAHEYGNLDDQTLWLTISQDIPALKAFCEDQIKKFDQDI